MADTSTPSGAVDPGALYGAEYYHSHCGEVPYSADSQHWQQFYGAVADEIVRSFTPRRVFDAGCAVGLLVAALWDRNVEAHGRDISDFAIAQVRPDVRPYCAVGSIADPIDGDYDLVLCIEVLEHMPAEEALAAIRTITRVAPRVLFSSTPSDFDEPTHVNVRPIPYWLHHFAEAGFAPVIGYDPTFLCPHAVLFERSDEGRAPRDLAVYAELVRQRLATAAEATKVADVAGRLTDVHGVLASEQAARRAADAEWQARLQATDFDWRERVHGLELRALELERAAALPLGVYRLGRRAGRVAWWTASMQLPQRLRERRERLHPAADDAVRTAGDAAMPASLPDRATDGIAQRFAATEPLRTFAIPGAERRITIVTDSVAEGSLYGGVGTAFILARLLAERLEGRLRLVTRTEPAEAERVRLVLEAQGLAWPREIELVHAPAQGDDSVPLSAGDVFLTTSWWTTRATLESVPRDRVIYLLQEDERMFYPRGDDRLRCAETLETPDLRVLVNSALLFEHLTAGPEPLPALTDRADWFEPAFPEALFHEDSTRDALEGRRTFVFYARPNNLRNLYWRGLEALSAAIEEGILDPAQWQFVFVGKDIGPVTLPGGAVPEILENLPWDRYAEVIRGAHLGMALMDTPHVSYPPLDLAASGAVVVTNTCGIKQSLAQYSANIIAVPPTLHGICQGLREGVALVDDEPRRRRNQENSNIHRDWRVTLERALDRCVTWIEG